MKNHKTLKEFLSGYSQKSVAEMMGVSQGAVCQMIRSGRDIRVVVDDADVAGAQFYEIRPIGKRVSAA